jgi:hypothetical protein
MVSHVTCDLNPIAGWVIASAFALTFVAFGMYLRRVGRIDWYHCPECGRWLKGDERYDHTHQTNSPDRSR